MHGTDGSIPTCGERTGRHSGGREVTLGRGIQQAAGLPKPVGNPVALTGTQGMAALPRGGCCRTH